MVEPDLNWVSEDCDGIIDLSAEPEDILVEYAVSANRKANSNGVNLFLMCIAPNQSFLPL